MEVSGLTMKKTLVPYAISKKEQRFRRFWLAFNLALAGFYILLMNVGIFMEKTPGIFSKLLVAFFANAFSVGIFWIVTHFIYNKHKTLLLTLALITIPLTLFSNSMRYVLYGNISALELAFEWVLGVATFYLDYSMRRMNKKIQFQGVVSLEEYRKISESIQSASQEELDKIFHEGTRKWPDYFSAAFMKDYKKRKREFLVS